MINKLHLAMIELYKMYLDRVQYLIAHHHTYDNIDGIDYQILVELIFLLILWRKGHRKRQL